LLVGGYENFNITTKGQESEQTTVKYDENSSIFPKKLAEITVTVNIFIYLFILKL